MFSARRKPSFCSCSLKDSGITTTRPESSTVLRARLNAFSTNTGVFEKSSSPIPLSNETWATLNANSETTSEYPVLLTTSLLIISLSLTHPIRYYVTHPVRRRVLSRPPQHHINLPRRPEVRTKRLVILPSFSPHNIDQHYSVS